jgi:hypothetical protein
MQDRIDDDLTFGVSNIWIVDPVAQRAYVCSRNSLHEPEGSVLRAVGSAIEVSLPELFAELE